MKPPVRQDGRGARGIGLRLIAAAVGVGLAALGGEITVRLLVPAETRFAVWPPNVRRVFRPLPELIPGIEGPARFTVNALGLRGRDVLPEHGGEYRILAIGGSTTECAYLDDGEVWTSLLEEKLGKTRDGRGVWVGNAGRAGMNSRDHVLHARFLTAQPPRLDAVLLLAGVNDLTVALAQGESYVPPRPLSDPGAEREQIRRAFLVVPGRLQDAPMPADAPWYGRTATYQLVRRAGRIIRTQLSDRGLMQDEGGRTAQTFREHRKRAARMLDTLPDLTLALGEYRRNLDAIIDVARQRSLRVVLMTQPAIWRPDLPRSAEALLWLGGVGDFQREPGKAYYTVPALSEAMRRYNETVLEVCRTRNVECLDLAARVPKDPSMFYDDVHFTERGAQVVAEALAAYLRGQPPFDGGPVTCGADAAPS